MSRILLFLIFSVISYSVAASDYYWANSSNTGAYYLSAEAYCLAKEAQNHANQGNWVYSGINWVSPTQAGCKLASGGVFDYAYRYGSACPSGTEYDSTTGECKSPSNPCLAKKGQTTKWAITGNTNDPNTPVRQIKSSSGTYYTFTREPVIDGCEVKSLVGSKCIFKPDGIFACAGSGQFTGEQKELTSDTVPESVDIQPEPGESTQESECTSWTEDAEGRRHMTCNVTTEQTLDGGSQCGQVNGEWQCIKPSPKPESTKNASEQKITEETLAGGDKKKTTETTVNKTYCSEGACTTTTTKTTNVTITGSDGSTKSSTDSCTGPGCSKPSQPDEQKPPEEEKPEPAASGLACTESVSCTGDAVQCAMLRTEKEQKCNAEKAGDYNEYKDEIEQAVSGDNFKMEEGDENISSVLTNISRFLPSSCPAPIQINTNLAGTVSLPLDQLCSFAEIFGHFFVAFAGLFFIRQIAASDGGS